MPSFKQIAIKAAKEAGKIQLKHYGQIKDVKSKGKAEGLVTNADLECEKKITQIIQKNFPDHNILAEEEKYKKTDSEYKWIIDPIDGTHNFLYQLSMFGVSIALEKNGKIILGVIYLPIFKQLYLAEKGKGASLNNKPIKVSNQKDLNQAMVQFDGNLGLLKKEKLNFIEKIMDHIFRLRISGCAVWDLTSIASGKADICVCFSTHPWDVAASFLIIEEAGGKITDFQGNPWSQYMNEFIATNSILHQEVLTNVKKF